MPKLELAEIMKFEITIDEIIQLTRFLLKETKQRKIRTALKVMITEFKRANKPLVEDVFIPLYDIDSKETFDRNFGRVQSKFKKMYLEGKPILDKIHCHKIINKIEALKTSQSWKKHVPGFRRSILRFELLTDQWAGMDVGLYQADRELYEELNGFLNAVGDIKDQDSKKAYKELRKGLSSFEKEYMAIKDKFAELEVLSDQI